MKDCELFISLVIGLTLWLLGIAFGGVIFCKSIEIQEIKQVDNGYYITINNEIYYKE